MRFFSNYCNELFNLAKNTRVSGCNNEDINLADGYNKTIEIFKKIQDRGNKIIIVGNGGSASIACHIQTDLSNLFIRAMTFNNPSPLTAFSNDFGYNFAFERFVNLWAEQDDLLIGISSSGQSENILRAARAAHEKGSIVLTFSGFQEDNPLRSLGNLNFYVSSSHYGHVETVHSILVHSLTDCYSTKYPKEITE